MAKSLLVGKYVVCDPSVAEMMSGAEPWEGECVEEKNGMLIFDTPYGLKIKTARELIDCDIYESSEAYAQHEGTAHVS